MSADSFSSALQVESSKEGEEEGEGEENFLTSFLVDLARSLSPLLDWRSARGGGQPGGAASPGAASPRASEPGVANLGGHS